MRMLLAWLVAFVWAGFIWGFGGDSFSMSSTSRLLEPLLDWLLADWSAVERQRALVAVRKLAHVAEYALFALLVGRAIALAFASRMRFVTGLALAAVALLAVADELRQALSAMRTGSTFDVALDLLGGVAALGALFLIRRRLGRPMFTAAAANPRGELRE